jgi:hypothetical protein
MASGEGVMAIIGPYNYSQGLNTDASLITIPNGQLSTLTNMTINQNQLMPIPGYSTASITQPPSITNNEDLGMLGFGLSDSNYLFLLGINVSTPYVYVMSNLTGSWSSNIIASTGFSVEFDYAFCAEVLNSVVTIGSQFPIISSISPGGTAAQWTGSGNLVNFTGPSNTGIFKVVNNFLFALGADGTLSWSSVADGTTWPASNFVTFRFGDGDISTALGKIGTTVYIFKLKSMGALQTTSVILAGAVALGPLYTIYDKIGTFSMRSIDNLPTGELVFVGTDFNVYKFDGSNLTNLSKRTYPQSSIQGTINSFLSSYPGSISSNNVWLKVNPLQNCFYVTFGGVRQLTSQTLFLAYDYVQDYWYIPGKLSSQGYVFGDYVYLSVIGNTASWFSTGPTQIFLGLNNFSSPSKIYSVASTYTSFNGVPIPGQAIISIPYTFESRDTIPRSAIVPFSGNASDTFTITQGADGTYAASGISPTPTGNLQRVMVPLNFEDKTMTAQIEIVTSTTNLYSINPVFLDTEIAN